MLSRTDGNELGRRVCVIGAGISGLVTAKVLKADGFDVVVFEKESTLGGVWASSRTYPGLRANNPRDTYAFSDYPFPPTASDFPSAAEMRAYLRSYAERFGILACIQLGTEVVQVDRALAPGPTERGWKVTVRSRGTRQLETLDFDFAVVCNGVFCEPRIPSIEGIDRFAGRALHSSQLTDLELVRGKRVIVVGGGKSALDCAAWAAREGRSCTLVFRQAYWMLPRYLFGVINPQWFIFSRLTESFLGYHRLNRLEAVLHGVGRPLVRGMWWSFTRLLRWQTAVPGSMLPEPLPRNFEYLGVGTEAYELARSGRIRTERTTIRRFPGGKAVELESGETLEADVAIFATGWRQGVPFFEKAIRRQVEREDGFQLYRLILPPAVSGLGFVGYNSSTACQLTAEVGAHWLSQHFLGALRLPGVDEMHREIARVRQWASRVMPARSQGFFIGPHVTHYLDELLRDMGLPTARRTNFVAENLLPQWPSNYQTLAEERRHAREGRTPPSFYLSAAHGLGLLALAALAWIVWPS